MQISEGYKCGLIGVVTELHARYYDREHGFGADFEAKVAAGLAEFVPRLGKGCNQIWHISNDDRFVASIAIDGEDLGNNIAHLRWFIVDDVLRGDGAGRELLNRALNFCDHCGFEACDLWTFKGLDSARHLYESTGFVLEEQWQGDQWGTEVEEQRFRRIKPA